MRLTEKQYDNGIDWCQDYIAITLALNDYIEQGEMDATDALIEQRQGLLKQLPEIVEVESGKEETKGTFIEMLETIKSLENKGKNLIKSQMNEIIRDIGKVKRFRRSSNVYQKNTVSRFIDTRS